MEEVFGLLLVFGVIVGGWVLGIIGFTSARRALREVAALRVQVEGLSGTEAMPRASMAGAVPDHGGMPAPPRLPEHTTDGAAATRPSIPSPWAPASHAADAPGGQPSGTPGTTPGNPADAPPGDTAGFPEPDAPYAEPPPPGRSLEDLLTARWGVWAGAVALLMSGVFLIRYAVENDLLGPEVRCLLGFLLGAALIGGAQWLRRRSDGSDQAPPALASGGVAILGCDSTLWGIC